MADRDAEKVPTDTRSRAPAEPIGVFLEEAHIKLSSLVSNLIGASARRMLKALAEGETNPAALAALAGRCRAWVRIQHNKLLPQSTTGSGEGSRTC